MRPPVAIVDEILAVLSNANAANSRPRAFHFLQYAARDEWIVALPGWPRLTAGGDIRARLAQILDIFFDHSQRNVSAGESRVRPPGAPTSGRMYSRPWVNPWRLLVPFGRKDQLIHPGARSERP
jgi:hypothetical protein